MSAAACALVAAWMLSGCSEPLPSAVPTHIDGVPVDEAALLAVYGHVAESDVLRFDPVAIIRLQAGVDVTHPWAEHPRGEIRIRTNNLGLRSDEPVVADAPHGRRVLVVGDSHTFGFVNDDECLHERLESLLEVHTGDEFEVINAAVGSTGPVEQAGSLEAYLSLAPEAVVVVSFSGNDFRDALIVADLKAGRPKHGLVGDAAERLTTVREHWPRRTCLSQGYVQALVFKQLGDAAVDIAVDEAMNSLERMAALCATANVPVIFAMLPTKLDVDGDDDAFLLTTVRDQLDLSAADFGVNRRLALRVVDAMRARGHLMIDLHDALHAEPEPVFWRRDLHLSLRGHDVVAREILPTLAAALGSP